MWLYLHGLLQHPAADGAQQVLIHVPMEAASVVTHGTSLGLPQPWKTGDGSVFI